MWHDLTIAITVWNEHGRVVSRKRREGLSKVIVDASLERELLGYLIAGAESSAREAIRDAIWEAGRDPRTGMPRP